MNRGVRIIALLLALVLAMAAGWFFSHYHAVSEEIRLPAKGEAAYNPLYALQQSLRGLSIGTESHPWLILSDLKLGPRDTLVLYAAQQGMTMDQSVQLLAWVERGGHLVMPAPIYDDDVGPLVKALKLRALPGGSGDEKAWGEADPDAEPELDCHKLAGSTVVGTEPGRDVLHLCKPPFASDLPAFSYGDGSRHGGYRFGRLRSGQGVVSVVSGLDFLDNRTLETPAARELAFALLAPRLHEGRMHLIYSADVASWWRLLLRNGWPVLLPLALALLAWLAWRSQRFGPLLPVSSGHRRALLEHVRAAGEFAYQRQRGSALHTAVLALLRKRLARREPMIAALDGEALVMALSEHLNMDAARIRRALRPTGLLAPDAFLDSVSTLIAMRNRL